SERSILFDTAHFFLHIFQFPSVSIIELQRRYSCTHSCRGGTAMATTLRIATFNLENFDDKPNTKPTLDERITLMRPQLLRLNADILCLQEVNGQEQSGQPRRLLALDKLLTSTPYSAYHRVSTMTANGTQVYDERNLVILSRFEIVSRQQRNPADAPLYRMITALPAQLEAKEILWERPILQATIKLDDGRNLELFNVH